MSFGKNPHVAKATLAEQKAQSASDVNARALAWREAARLWERAAEREPVEKRVVEYQQRAEGARQQAAEAERPEPEGGPEAPAATPRTALN
ncbi:MAG: hypothetical protein JNK72_16415 [Myxococcales bacterium]|nr:hypothetical protein [Myxococcales bacterium]